MATAAASSSSSSPAAPSTRVPFWVLVNGVAKKNNIGQIIRSACAFGAESLVFVGKGHASTHGAQGTHKHLRLDRFARLQEAVDHFHAKGARIVGVEITPSARSVSEEPFSGPTVLFMGNEGHGLSEEQKAACDDFVYIPQFGSGTASLNVSVAAGVVMHRFACWAGYRERERVRGEDKFAVEELPDPAARPRTEAELTVRAERALKRAKAAAEDAARSSDTNRAPTGALADSS